MLILKTVFLLPKCFMTVSHMLVPYSQWYFYQHLSFTTIYNRKPFIFWRLHGWMKRSLNVLFSAQIRIKHASKLAKISDHTRDQSLTIQYITSHSGTLAKLEFSSCCSTSLRTRGQLSWRTSYQRQANVQDALSHGSIANFADVSPWNVNCAG